MMLQFAILFLASVVLAVDYTNEAAFRSKFNSDVAVHYAAAMDNYNNLLAALSNQLANYDPNNVQSLLKPIDPALLQSSQQFVSNMKLSSVSANEMIKEIDSQMVAHTNQISQVDAQISSLNGQIKDTQIQIQKSQDQVNLATQALNQAGANLATQQRALQEAQKRLNDAHQHCLGRRKRDIWGDIWHTVEKTGQDVGHAIEKAGQDAGHAIEKAGQDTGHAIEKTGQQIMGGICDALNALTKQVDNAARDVNNAQNTLNAAQTHRDQVAQQLASQQAQLQNQQVALQGQQGQLAQLGAQLNAMKVNRDQINAVDQKMKVTLAFIDSMVARGQVIKFNVDIGYLLDANNIVMPLSEMGNLMANLGDKTLNTHVLPSLTSAQVAALKQKLDAIAGHAKGR